MIGKISSYRNEFRYSFDYGMVHVVMLSTEHNITIGSEQYE